MAFILALLVIIALGENLLRFLLGVLFFSELIFGKELGKDFFQDLSNPSKLKFTT